MGVEPTSPAPLAPSERPERYGSGMLRRWGWFYRVLGLQSAMKRVRFEDHSTERIRSAAREGPIVYVLLRRSTLDHLALNAVLNRRRLPLSVWSHGAIRFFWQPVREAWAEVFQRIGDRFRRGPRPHPVRSGWLSAMIASGQTTCLFLEEGHDKEVAAEDDPLHAVLDAARRTGRNVQLVPVICVWDRAPDTHESAALTFLRGSRERPSLLARLRRLYVPGPSAPFVQVGEPVDVQTFLSRVPPERALDSLRTLLRRYLKRESRTVRGPTIIPRQALKEIVLGAPPMRRFAEDHATSTGRTPAEVRRDMSAEFDKIAADFRFGVIRFASWAFRPLWTRVYAGYEVPDEDLDKIRAAIRDGTAVLVPCHKSHFDYLLLSWVLYHANLITPHIVAGINLAIWPVSILLRGAGAFFIERSFNGKPVHAAVFQRYLRELLLHGYTVEFFIEGGRTRTGRLLPAKLGVLDMVLDAAHHAPRGHEITFLPIAISYEQVAEERSYQDELGGADKRKEDMRELIKARRVLRNRYGRIFVRVGEPLKASEVVDERWGELSDDARRDRIQHTGDELVHRIGQVLMVLPTSVVALALMAHHRSGISEETLAGRVDRFVAWLGRRNAPMTQMVAQHPEGARARALGRFQQAGHVRAHEAEGAHIWEIVPDHRTVLDFHKNQIAHHFIAAGMVAAALRACPTGRCTRDDLLEPIERLRALWVRELALAPDVDAAALVAEGTRDLLAHGAIATDRGEITVADAERIGEIHGIVRGLLESYLVVCLGAVTPGLKGGDLKAWSKQLTARRDVFLAEGVATRPEAFATVTLTHALKELTRRGVFRAEGDALVGVREQAEAEIAWLRPMIEGPTPEHTQVSKAAGA